MNGMWTVDLCQREQQLFLRELQTLLQHLGTSKDGSIWYDRGIIGQGQ